jgi:hypothetical protein
VCVGVCDDGAAMLATGVETLALLEKLDDGFIVVDVWKRSFCNPSNMCMSVLSEFVAVAD